MKRTLLLLSLLFVLLLSGCESLATATNNVHSKETEVSTTVQPSLTANDSSAKTSTATENITGETDYSYQFNADENNYFVAWNYKNGDKIFNIDKNCGIFIASVSHNATQDKLLETSLKKELQALGYNNIVLGSYSSDFDTDSVAEHGDYALKQGCLYMILFAIEDYRVFENGGGLSDSNIVFTVFDLDSAFSHTNGIFDSVSYNFMITAKNNFQSFNSSLVTFDKFMSKIVMSSIKEHLTGEEGNAEQQRFFENGQNRL